MKNNEIAGIILAIFILTLVISFKEIIASDFSAIGTAFLFALVLIIINVFAKKIMASSLDAGVEHQIWNWSRFGFKPGQHFKKEIPMGVILPLFITAISLGTIKLMTLITYEATALKRRAAKRFGHYSFTEMTEWHNGLIGAAGIIAILLLSFISYWIPGLEQLSRLAAFYAFFNMIPISNLDGSQIFFGSRVLWYVLAIITLIFTSYALLLI